MHCDACAEQLKRKILKMKGVIGAETDASSGKVTVTGSMEAEKLVEYVYRRTKKQAKIVPQPEPDKPAEEAKPEEKKEEEKKKEEEAGGEKKAAEGEKKEGGGAPPQPPEEQGGGERGVINSMGDPHHHEQMMHKMMYHYYQPLYMIERIPPPQLFSDENPNACCIT